MKNVAVGVMCSISLAALMTISKPARAEPSKAREPIKPVPAEGTRSPLVEAKVRTTELVVDRYNRVQKVVRMRHEGKTYASFSADPQLIDKGAAILFEIHSISPKGGVSRWRCVAVNDVAECLGVPIKVRWLEGEDRMVLTATLKPQNEAGAGFAGLASK
jgi:hypothetical protein